MGTFQASMLEAFQSLREELATQKKVEVESSLPASKPGSSSNNAAPLDLILTFRARLWMWTTVQHSLLA